MRTFTSVGLAALLALGVAACGDDAVDEGSPQSDDTLPSVPTAPDKSTTPDGSGVPVGSGGFDHPTGADDVVIEYAEVGGFVPREFAFQQTPNLLVSGDGRAFSPGAQIAIYPGPLLPAVQVQTITGDGIQAILVAADDAGLLAEVDYEEPTNIADASTARLTITVDGETYVHEAYALGLALPGAAGQETTPERQALADFIAQLGDLPTLVGTDELGETTLAEADSYAIEALAIDDLAAYGSDGIEPTVVEWPAAAKVRLADASTCTVVAAADVGALLAEANQLTFFSEDGQTYQVLARPILPGGGC